MFATTRRLLLKQFHLLSRIQETRVSFVGVDVNFQLAGGIRSHEQVFEYDRALWGLNAKFHETAVLYPVMLCVAQTHVHMSRSPDDTLGKLDDSFRTN